MNYYDAREVQDPSSPNNGRWNYTCMNSGRIWKIGYCAGWTEPKRNELIRTFGESFADRVSAAHEKLQEHKDRFHLDGHATKEEAYACYKQFILDSQLDLDRSMPDQMMRCLVCHEFTQGLAFVDHITTFVLCDKHRTREEAERRYSVGIMISSY